MARCQSLNWLLRPHEARAAGAYDEPCVRFLPKGRRLCFAGRRGCLCGRGDRVNRWDVVGDASVSRADSFLPVLFVVRKEGATQREMADRYIRITKNILAQKTQRIVTRRVGG